MSGQKEIVGVLRGAHRNIENYIIPICANDPTIIGSLPHSDFQIKDPRISYFHAVIHTVKYHDKGIHVPFIEDLSENGTYLNHQPIGCRRTAALFQGCIISFATSDFEFYYIPRKAYEFAQLRDVEITLATAIEEFTPNNGITSDKEDHDSRQGNDDIIIRLTDLIAEGGEASIHLAIPLKAQAYPLACKIRNYRSIRQSSIRIQEEIEIMRYCQHVGILPLLGVHKPDPKRDCWYLLTPLATGGDLDWKIRAWQEASDALSDAAKKQPHLKLPFLGCMSVIRCIFYQLAMAVYYLHSEFLDRRETKAKRVIIHGAVQHPHIAFFKEKANVRLTEGGTYQYWAPELFRKHQETGVSIDEPEKVDIWALGLILYEMIARRHALVDKKSLDYNDIMANIYNNEPNFDYIASREDVGPEVKVIIQWCLKKNPAERPTIKQLLGIGGASSPDTIEGKASEWIHNGCDIERFGEFVARSRAEKSIWSAQSFVNNASSSHSTENEGEESRAIASKMDNLYVYKNMVDHEQETIVNMTRKEKHIRPGQFPNSRWMLEVLDNESSSS
ncbi:predicted protein [Lichtheimia corymbifera JMRC:FSU:9682]|uniref:non-specific serine/threonine protein kinase n=1 Tax=Lichtheimia corymbifera JMRC:FSU:9682 TaxID=1263082 RepID=A0A068S6U1_9FUNG|nr:predicted protein [Lichtheimia corymbifera JMRC:FSU:9682]